MSARSELRRSGLRISSPCNTTPISLRAPAVSERFSSLVPDCPEKNSSGVWFVGSSWIEPGLRLTIEALPSWDFQFSPVTARLRLFASTKPKPEVVSRLLSLPRLKGLAVVQIHPRPPRLPPLLRAAVAFCDGLSALAAKLLSCSGATLPASYQWYTPLASAMRSLEK